MTFYTNNVKKLTNKFRLKTINMSDLQRAMSSINTTNFTDYYGLNENAFKYQKIN